MKKSKKQIMIVLLVILLVIGAVLFFLLGPKDAPKEQEVIDLLQQAAEIYHPNHSSLSSVQELVAVGSKDNPAEHGYYDEVSDYDSVVCAVFSENGIRELENSYLPEGPIIISAISLVPCPINILPRLFPCSCFLKTAILSPIKQKQNTAIGKRMPAWTPPFL